MSAHFKKRSPLPTPEEIRRECARIRRGWSQEERRHRRVSAPVPWEPPVVPAAFLEIDDRDEEGD